MNEKFVIPPVRPRVTQETVAKAAGVDKSTVSIVLSGSPRAERISKRTQRRILAAAKRLKYRPNLFASQLRKGPSLFILLCVQTLQDRQTALIAEAVECRAAERGYRIIVSCFTGIPNPAQTVEEMLGPHGISSLVMVGAAKDVYDSEAFDHLLDEGIRPVLVGRTHQSPGVSSILCDEWESGRIVVQHLLEQGVRDFWILCDPIRRWQSQEVRIAAALEAARNQGFPEPRILQSAPEGTESSSAAQDAVSAMLSKGSRPAAIFATRGALAFGAIRALREHGIVPGRDVAVIGNDDFWPSDLVLPSLTMVRQPLSKMGAAAADAVIDQLSADGPIRRQLLYAPQLVRGETSLPLLS